MPCSRATCDAVLPGRDDSATIRSFSSRLQRRRRSTDSASREITGKTRQPSEDAYILDDWGALLKPERCGFEVPMPYLCCDATDSCSDTSGPVPAQEFREPDRDGPDK
jgi:hypothetical protein